MKILVIFICLQTKLQLFQEYRSLFEIFFAVVQKKLVFFQVERLLKIFYDAAKQVKSHYSGAENRKLNTVTNMVAKIDIDALNIFFFKSRTNDTENRQKIKNSQSQF